MWPDCDPTLAPLFDIEVPSKPFENLTKAESKSYYAWYLQEYEQNTEGKIRNVLGVEPLPENVKLVAKASHALIAEHGRLEKLPWQLQATQRVMLGKKLAYLFDPMDLSSGTISLALGLSFIESWLTMVLSPEAKWYLETRKSYNGYNEPCLLLPNGSTYPPITTTIRMCYTIIEKPQGFEELYKKLLRFTGHLVD